MWTFEVVPLGFDIVNYLIPTWHVAQTSSILLKNVFIAHLLDLIWDGCSCCDFPKYVRIYLLGNRLLQATLCSCFAWSHKYLKPSRISIYLSIAFKSYPCHKLICCEVGLVYHSYIPPRNFSIYSLSITGDTLNCGGCCRPSSYWLLHWIALFIAKFILTLVVSLTIAWILLNWLSSVLKWHMKSNYPICVHFLFKCKF